MSLLTPSNTIKATVPGITTTQTAPSDYSVTIHLLPHTDATRTTPPAQFDPERRDLYEGTVLKIGRQVRAAEAPEAPVNALATGPLTINTDSTPMVIEPPPSDPSGTQPSDEDAMNLSPLTPMMDTRGRAATSTADAPVSSPSVEVLLAQPGGQQPLVPTKTIEHVWFKSKVVSRGHAEMWLRDGQVYLKDTGSSSGTFLNKMRLSPSGKLSRPYPLKDGDVIQLGIDYQGRQEDIYKCIMMKIVITTSSIAVHQRKKENPARFRTALRSLLNATNPYSSNTPTPTSANQPQQPTASVDCCICLCAIGPFQALFLSPCSHCYHYKCIRNLLETHHMFQCPMCRQVANLDASVSMESLLCEDDDDGDNGHDEVGGVTMNFGRGLTIEGGGIVWGGDGGNGGGSSDTKKEKKALSEQEKVDMSIDNLERAGIEDATRTNEVSEASNGGDE
ncbi:UNVERIFIED_CONTAM: hypothetical protein HDU68_009351 [Siphonaria sp. JEL0065]|nr:hypothetical protein HDU68_009351 [Siphonaria sp. JEL0065]